MTVTMEPKDPTVQEAAEFTKRPRVWPFYLAALVPLPFIGSAALLWVCLGQRREAAKLGFKTGWLGRYIRPFWFHLVWTYAIIPVIALGFMAAVNTMAPPAAGRYDGPVAVAPGNPGSDSGNTAQDPPQQVTNAQPPAATSTSFGQSIDIDGVKITAQAPVMGGYPGAGSSDMVVKLTIEGNNKPDWCLGNVAEIWHYIDPVSGAPNGGTLWSQTDVAKPYGGTLVCGDRQADYFYVIFSGTAGEPGSVTLLEEQNAADGSMPDHPVATWSP